MVFAGTRSQMGGNSGGAWPAFAGSRSANESRNSTIRTGHESFFNAELCSVDRGGRHRGQAVQDYKEVDKARNQEEEGVASYFVLAAVIA